MDQRFVGEMRREVRNLEIGWAKAERRRSGKEKGGNCREVKG